RQRRATAAGAKVRRRPKRGFERPHDQSMAALGRSGPTARGVAPLEECEVAMFLVGLVVEPYGPMDVLALDGGAEVGREIVPELDRLRGEIAREHDIGRAKRERVRQVLASVSW